MVVSASSRDNEAPEVDLIDGVVAAAIWGEKILAPIALRMAGADVNL